VSALTQTSEKPAERYARFLEVLEDQAPAHGCHEDWYAYITCIGRLHSLFVIFKYSLYRTSTGRIMRIE
jgi:hypothetical protein